MKPSIVVVFDDLFPGGLRTLNEKIWNEYNHKGQYSMVVVSGINFDQQLQKDTFPYADELHVYSIPPMNQFFFFFYCCWHTIRLIHHIKNNHTIQCVIGNNSFSGAAARVVSLVFGIRYIYFYHGSLFQEVRSLGHISTTFFKKAKMWFMHHFYWFVQYCCVYAAPVVCFSTHSRFLLHHDFHKTKHVHTLSVPFRYTPLSQRTKRSMKETLGFHQRVHVLLFPSRLEPRKGLHMLTQALSLLPNTLSVVVLVAGPLHGESIDYLVGLIKQTVSNTERQRIYFMGEVPVSNMKVLYGAADVTIVPSIGLETLGMVTLESLSYGTPVIGFPTGATPDILTGIDKNLIAKRISPQSLARTITLFFHRPHVHSMLMQKQIQAYIQTHHSPSLFTHQLTEVLSNRVRSPKVSSAYERI